MGEVKIMGGREVFTIEQNIGGKKLVDEAVPFEEALDLTGIGRYSYMLFAVSIVVILSMALEIFGTSYVVTASACDLDMNTFVKGVVAAMPMAGIVAASPLWGWLADTRGRRFVLLLSMSGSCLCGLLSSVAPVWPVLAAGKFLAAFFASASNAVTYALLGECVPRSHRGRLIMALSCGLMGAQAFMAVNAYIILHMEFDVPITGDFHYRPWRLLQQVCCLWGALSVALLWGLVRESPKFYASVGRDSESVAALRLIYQMNTGRPAEEYPVGSVVFSEARAESQRGGVLAALCRQARPLFRPPLLRDTLLIGYAVIVVYTVAPALLMWTPTIASAFSAGEAGAHDGFCNMLHAARRGVANATLAAINPQAACEVKPLTFLMLFVYSAFTAALNIGNSMLIRVVSKRALLVFYNALSGLCGLALPWLADVNAAVVVFFLFQVNLVVMALTTGFTVEVYPTYLRATAVCLTMMAGRGASFVLISMMGWMLESHCELTFYGLGLAVLSAAVIGFFLPPEQRITTQEKTISR